MLFPRVLAGRGRRPGADVVRERGPQSQASRFRWARGYGTPRREGVERGM